MDDATLAPTRYRLTADEYQRMGEAGIFGDNKRIELIDGDLIDMAPIGSGHAANVMTLNEALVFACAGRAFVSTQSSIRLDRYSEPQPDFAILRRRADVYVSALPTPADILLLVEVADTSLTFDRTVKLPLYARAGIPELWIVDLPHHRLPYPNFGNLNEHHAHLRFRARQVPGRISELRNLGFTVFHLQFLFPLRDAPSDCCNVVSYIYF